MKLTAVVLFALTLLIGCGKSPKAAAVFYEPNIFNYDTDASWLWQYIPPNRVADVASTKLREHYESQTNYFRGSIVVHRVIGTNSAICVYKSVLCNSASNTYLISDGFGLTNATTRSSFKEVSDEIVEALKRDVASHSVQR